MEKIKKQDALIFTNDLANIYFNERNMDALPLFMEEKTSWIGTGKDEICRDIWEAKAALQEDAKEYCGSFLITENQFEFIAISDNVCIVYGKLTAVPKEQTLAEENLRMSVVLEMKEEGLKLIHMHFSHADTMQEQGHYFVSQSARADNQSLRMALSATEKQLVNLTKNVPGGAHQCANDEELTLLSVSDGFLTMFGYTEEEIDSLFGGKYINMVFPEDREELFRSCHEQIKSGPTLELEYRVRCKNGKQMWVLDKGRLIDDGNGGECFYCLLIEITERKYEQEELRLSLERHKVIMDQATDVIFEWDIRNDTLNFSSNFRKRFGYEAINTKISNRIPVSEDIHPDDMKAFIKIMEDTAAGVPYSETEFRIKNMEGDYLWCRIRATTQFDSNGKAIKAVGVIVDIDAEKKQRQILIDQAQRDALTGLYNKTAVRVLAEQSMQEKKKFGVQALLIIDVDHFKAVNDTYGHLCGDLVLSDVAAAIRSSIRTTDLVGRIGGDEFLVYLPEVADEEAVHKKAKQLLEALEVITPIPGAAPITCSIGTAVFPHGSIDYYALYKCADQALYQKKSSGRKGVAFFGTKTERTDIPCGLSPSAVNSNIVSDESLVSDEGLGQYAFRTLYAATDIEVAINQLLEILGRSFDVSRAYIFESSEDRQCCSNTFEWCNQGISPQMEQLQNLDYGETLGNYLQNFDENGLFYCHDVENLHPSVCSVLKAQGIRSMIQCAMMDEGEFVGYVGFDECRENRTWSQRQVSSFKLSADVLTTFLIKMRHKRRNR